MGHSYGGEPYLVMRAGGLAGIYRVGAVMGVLILAVLLALVLTDVIPLLGAVVNGGLVLATGLVIWAILPTRYELYADRLLLVFPLWRWGVDMATIREAHEAHTIEAYAFLGVRFATAPSQGIVIHRVGESLFRRPALVISPEDRSVFLPELRTVLSRFQRLQAKG